MIFKITQTKNQRYLKDGLYTSSIGIPIKLGSGTLNVNIPIQRKGTGNAFVATENGEVLADSLEYLTGPHSDVIIKGKDYENVLRHKFDIIALFKAFKTKENVLWRIYENEILIGGVKYKGVSRKGFNSFNYNELQYKGVIYECYEVGLGKDGWFFCFYKNGELVAIVERSLESINYLDEYTCYLSYREDYPAIIAYMIQQECIGEENGYMESGFNAKQLMLNTTNKEVLAKYDPTFIPKIKELEQN